MAPLNLQGLNVVHTSSDSAQADLQDSLVSPFPDFSAHLDLWTNLTFDTTDDTLIHQRLRRKSSDTLEDETQSPPPLGSPIHDSHENAAQPAPVQVNPNMPALPFDLNTLITTFGVNPFLVQPGPSTPQQQHQQHQLPPPLPNMPSLAQLFAMHTAQGGASNIPPPPPPVIPAQPASHMSPSPAPSAAVASTSQPSAKRARTHRNASVSDTSDVSAAQSPQDMSSPTSVNAAEDKRRRNTAASARFRLKKKEREAALEKRAKELEDRVGELERECEGLRRENGWLKGLVVGVTGAGGTTQQPQK